jgi:hypothetical protein
MLYLLPLLSIALSVCLVIHCIKTGRNTIWIWVLVLLPVAGPIAYVAAELLPELLGSRTTQRAVRGVKKSLDPERDLRRFENEARLSGNVASRQRYADELVRLGRADQAVSVYRECLTGLFTTDPKLMLGLAQAQFAAGDGAAARSTLDALIAANPSFKSPDGHLLYARALESEGLVDKALDEYQTLASYYPGAEAGARYASLLRKSGQADKAREVARALVDGARLAPAHYQKAQRAWLDEAAKELRQ